MLVRRRGSAAVGGAVSNLHILLCNLFSNTAFDETL